MHYVNKGQFSRKKSIETRHRWNGQIEESTVVDFPGVTVVESPTANVGGTSSTLVQKDSACR